MKDMATETKAEVYYVPVDVIDDVFDQVRVLLEPAVATAKGTFKVDDVYDMLKSSEYLLWIVVEDGQIIAALTTRIAKYPQSLALAIDWLGGSKMRMWLPVVQEEMTRYAKFHGCSQIECYGRKGWDRWLRRYGWKPDHIVYKMEIDHG